MQDSCSLMSWGQAEINSAQAAAQEWPNWFLKPFQSKSAKLLDEVKPNYIITFLSINTMHHCQKAKSYFFDTTRLTIPILCTSLCVDILNFLIL